MTDCEPRRFSPLQLVSRLAPEIAGTVLACFVLVGLSGCGAEPVPIVPANDPWVGIYTLDGMEITVIRPDIDYRGTLVQTSKVDGKVTTDELQVRIEGGVLKGSIIRDNTAYHAFDIQRSGDEYSLMSGGKKESLIRSKKH